MKARSALGGLALVLGMALPAAAEAPAGMQVAQAPTDASRPAPGPAGRPHWGVTGRRDTAASTAITGGKGGPRPTASR